MIHYDEFQALPSVARDALCAKRMGWHLEPTADSLMEWATDGGGRGRLEVDWSPTTDRNDAAMMVEYGSPQFRCGRCGLLKDRP